MPIVEWNLVQGLRFWLRRCGDCGRRFCQKFETVEWDTMVLNPQIGVSGTATVTLRCRRCHIESDDIFKIVFG